MKVFLFSLLLLFVLLCKGYSQEKPRDFICGEVEKKSVLINLHEVIPKFESYAVENFSSDKRFYFKIEIAENGSVKSINSFSVLDKDVKEIINFIYKFQFSPKISRGKTVVDIWYMTIFFSNNELRNAQNEKTYLPLMQNEELVIDIK